ncbi:hypothetical protein [Prauserella endophytica]|uniref:ATP-binding protein n=1 Tax=Prauserella endophytica TaxID=1592324 RepID=A0ABY2RWU8_9PSEU|nr:hypothetical protein [Prauserella endophytica]TKG63764.1 hypothetical protein FCN18_29455 [Prauserella endophytica]
MPTRKDVQLAMRYVQRGSDLSFFFDELSSPDWIDPLREEGLFDSPPPPEISDDMARYPEWAPARYLARMATLSPERVASVILEIPDTENPRIHDAFAEAALQMPAVVSARLVPQFVQWLLGQRSLLLPIHSAKLATRLASEGVVTESLRLASALLTIDPPETLEGLVPRPIPRIGEHHFYDVVEELSGPFVEALGIPALEILREVLDDTLRFRSPPVGKPPFDDYSQIWRASLGVVERATDCAESLVNGVVHATLTLVRKDSDTANSVLKTLSAGAWKIERRIALFAIAQAPQSFNLELAASLVTRSDMINDEAYEDELKAAVSALWPRISLDRKYDYLTLVQNGPAVAQDFRDRIGEDWGEYVSVWQLKRIASIFNDIPEEFGEWADTVSRDRDLAALARPSVNASFSFVGPTSPLTADELSTLSIEDLNRFLSSWEPTNEWGAPSREGMGRILAAVVANNASRFADSANSFIGQQAVYMGSLISGLKEAVSKGAQFDWGQTLELCSWITEQGEISPELENGERETTESWRWVWMEVARLLAAAMSSTESNPTKSFSPQISLILRRLAQHPDPGLETEARFGGDNMDPTTLAMNTVRGEAIRAITMYSWWETDGSGPIPGEIRGVLATHADPDHDNSLAVHSVFGFCLPILARLDPQWLQTLIPVIFPQRPDLLSYRNAAWDSYLQYNGPSSAVLEMTRKEYAQAIGNLEHGGGQRRKRSIEALVRHVILLYLWGHVGLGNDDLLAKLLRAKVAGVHSEIVTFSGRILRQSEAKDDPDSQLSADQVARLKELWSSVRSLVESEAVSVDELTGFSWWCGCSSLDIGWWLPELHWLLLSGGSPIPAFRVVDALVEAAAVDPLTTIRVLRFLVDVVDTPWTFIGHLNSVRSTVAAVLAAGDEVAVRRARQLIHELGARDIANLSDML